MDILVITLLPFQLIAGGQEADKKAGRDSVNVVVLTSPEDVSVLVPILEALKGGGISSYGLKMRETWQGLSGSAISSRVDRATHFLLIASPSSSSNTWFPFAVGYGYGKNSRMALYRTDASWDPPRYLKGLPIIDNRDELLDFYRLEEAEWSLLLKRSAARAAILEMGISFHADSLAHCVEEGDLRAVELFLKAGFHPNSRDKHGVPLLCLATRRKHRAVVELLLEFSASIDLQSEDRGYSPLMDAVFVGSLELVELFLSRGAAVDLQSKDGQTALVIAVGRNDEGMARLLLESGADAEAKDKLGFTARKYAELFHNAAMLALFESHNS